MICPFLNVPFFSIFQAISQLMVFFINFVSTVFCGHLGDTELAGVAVAISVSLTAQFFILTTTHCRIKFILFFSHKIHPQPDFIS